MATTNTANNNWATWKMKAETMTVAELVWSLNDCIETASAMDAIDRTDNQDRAGRYRDEASVLRTELRTR